MFDGTAPKWHIRQLTGPLAVQQKVLTRRDATQQRMPSIEYFRQFSTSRCHVAIVFMQFGNNMEFWRLHFGARQHFQIPNKQNKQRKKHTQIPPRRLIGQWLMHFGQFALVNHNASMKRCEFGINANSRREKTSHSKMTSFGRVPDRATKSKKNNAIFRNAEFSIGHASNFEGTKMAGFFPSSAR